LDTAKPSVGCSLLPRLPYTRAATLLPTGLVVCFTGCCGYRLRLVTGLHTWFYVRLVRIYPVNTNACARAHGFTRLPQFYAFFFYLADLPALLRHGFTGCLPSSLFYSLVSSDYIFLYGLRAFVGFSIYRLYITYHTYCPVPHLSSARLLYARYIPTALRSAVQFPVYRLHWLRSTVAHVPPKFVGYTG